MILTVAGRAASRSDSAGSGSRICAMFAVLVACGHAGQGGGRCADPQSEAAGIAWDRLSGLVAYSRWETQYPPPETHGCIYVIDAGARHVTLVRDARTVPDEAGAPVGWIKDLALRADRSTLTFSVQDLHGRWQLRDLTFATGQEASLFEDPKAHHFAPAWSAEGRLAYYSNGPFSNDIFVDGNVAQSYANHTRVAWVSPTAFVASIADANSTGSLYLVDLARQWMTLIVNGWAASPAVDSVHGRVAYVHPDSDGESIWTADLDGAGQARRTIGASDYDPAWSSDGRSILFARSGQGLFLYDVDTGSVTRVTQQPVDSMAWAP